MLSGSIAVVTEVAWIKTLSSVRSKTKQCNSPFLNSRKVCCFVSWAIKLFCYTAFSR